MEPSLIPNNLYDIYNENVKIEGVEIEIEARFGIHSSSGFKPGISYDTFTKIYLYLHNAGYPKKVTEEVINNYSGNVKEIISKSKYVLRKKTKIHVSDIKEYNVRVAVSRETILPDDYKKGKIISTLNRIRYSFSYNSSVIDIDTYSDGNITVEIDTKLPKFDEFMSHVNEILYIIQDSYVLITNSEKINVYNYYCDTFKTKKFIGIQPVSLKQGSLDKDTIYACTKKLDGRRFVMLCMNKEVYLMANNLKDFVKLPYTSHTSDFLIDGEYFYRKFYAFDLITPNGVTLQDRLTKIADIFKHCKKYDMYPTGLFIKPYKFGDIYLSMKKLSDSLVDEYEDGLIVVKTNTDYFNSQPLKWKKTEKITIDFLIKRKPPNTYVFYVQGNKELKKFAENNVSLSTFGKYQNGDIVECSYKNGKWVPLKHRMDKLKPNYITIANDVYNTIKNPFKLEPIDNTPFQNLRKFHNLIKRKLIADIIDKRIGLNVLDLACGKGGDFGKYNTNKVKYVEAYDVSDVSLIEARRRAEKFDTKFNIIQQDLNTFPIKTKVKFDIVVCNFAFHYFYKNMTKIINKISTLCKPGAKILFTLFDGKLVKDIKGNNFYIKKIGKDKVEVYIQDSVLGIPTVEYIVNIDTLVKKMEKKGLILQENTNFSEFYDKWGLNLTKEEKILSFMNNALIFEKK